MATMTSYAEVVEGIRATIAAYTHALDDGRTDDVVATFCPVAVVVIPQRDNGWSVEVVGRYEDTLHNEGGTWRFHRRAATFVP